jgi:hypothetical protein
MHSIQDSKLTNFFSFFQDSKEKGHTLVTLYRDDKGAAAAAWRLMAGNKRTSSFRL